MAGCHRHLAWHWPEGLAWRAAHILDAAQESSLVAHRRGQTQLLNLFLFLLLCNMLLPQGQDWKRKCNLNSMFSNFVQYIVYFLFIIIKYIFINYGDALNKTKKVLQAMKWSHLFSFSVLRNVLAALIYHYDNSVMCCIPVALIFWDLFPTVAKHFCLETHSHRMRSLN